MREPDIIVLDRESPKKCTIAPLRYRDDLKFLRAYNLKANFTGCILLHVDGEPLSHQDHDLPLLLIDASWKWATKICERDDIKQLPKRSLSGFVTAYPRKSKIYEMPDNGLASVEAIYISRLIQGREDPSLLDHYYWKQQFLALNAEKLQHLREIAAQNLDYSNPNC